MNDNRSQSRIEIVNAMERATATWEIRDLVVSVGHWDSAKEVLILPIQVERISWDESSIFVKLTKETILGSPVYYDGSKLSNVKVGQ